MQDQQEYCTSHLVHAHRNRRSLVKTQKISTHSIAQCCLQVSSADISRLEQRIRSINGMAQIKQAQRAEVALEYVLGVGGFDLERVDAEVNISITHFARFVQSWLFSGAESS